jgi:hypothetical protein
MAGFIGATLLHASIGGAQQESPAAWETEISSEGLHRVNPQIIDFAWVHPELDLGHYASILFMPATVGFRDVRRRYNARDTNAEAFPVTEENQELLRIKFGEIFYEYVSHIEPFDVSRNVGREVLMVQGFLADIVSGIPPEIVGRTGTLVRHPWEASVVLELRDSMSNDLLARSFDRQRIEGQFDFSEIPRTTLWAVETWSDLLRTRVNELLEIGGGGWSRCGVREDNCAR